MRQILACIALAVAITSCNNNNETTSTTKEDFLSANLDTTVKPSEDFFLYANGSWIKKNPVPGDESAWGVGDLVQEDIYKRLRKINEDAAAKKNTDNSIEQKIADFWYTAMDSATIEKQGLQPLQQDLDAINNMTTG